MLRHRAHYLRFFVPMAVSIPARVFIPVFVFIPVPASIVLTGTGTTDRHQGVEGIDTDLPTRIEGLFFQNVFTKTLFCICQILFYAVRPMMVRQQRFTKWHALNWALGTA